MIPPLLSIGTSANDAWKDVHSRLPQPSLPLPLSPCPQSTSDVITFTTNVLLEALTLQSKATPGELPDRVLRTLLPYIAESLKEEEVRRARVK